MSACATAAIVGTDDISLTLEPGQTVALVGSNGAGKSSTLKAVMGLAAYPTGDILLDGRSIKEVRTSDIVRCRHRLLAGRPARVHRHDRAGEPEGRRVQPAGRRVRRRRRARVSAISRA